MNRFVTALLASLVLTACGSDSPTPTPAISTEHPDEHGEDSGEGSHEGEEGAASTEIHDEIAVQSGIETEAAGPVRIRETISLHGTIVPDPRRVFRLHARYPGIVRDVRGQIGDRVRKGALLVVVESDESLQRYNIVSPSDGVIVTRDANVGVNTGDAPLVTVVDLSTVWVELASFQHDLQGQAGSAGPDRGRGRSPERGWPRGQRGGGRLRGESKHDGARRSAESGRALAAGLVRHWRGGLP